MDLYNMLTFFKSSHENFQQKHEKFLSAQEVFNIAVEDRKSAKDTRLEAIKNLELEFKRLKNQK